MKRISVLISIIALIGLSRGEICVKPQDCTHEACRGSHLACHDSMCTCDPETNSPNNVCVTMDDCDLVGLCLKPGTRLTCIDGRCNCL
ncbi:hypothetical protein ACJMK2_027912 [Sinanodonta woodiana]|uniref:Uncharacterized protein n=1 Tax=Sinanodonta woodiana TaxID=1069815 RepID=A0ABD3X9B9_SINWO